MNFQYCVNPSPAQRSAAADLIDSAAQLAEPLDRARLLRACVVVIAIATTGRVVGVAAVKEAKGTTAEAGYLVVHPDFRRKGIAEELTRRRIAEAKARGLELLYANVRRDNQAPIGNLRKAGFRFWGEFISAYETGHPISWYYYPIKPDVDWEGRLIALTRNLKKAEVTG